MDSRDRPPKLGTARHFPLLLPLFVAILSALPGPALSATGWTSLGPEGGRIDGFAQSRSNPDRLYALPYRNGVVRSDDRGATWARVDVDLPMDRALRTVAVSPGDPDLVIVGEGEYWSDELFRSTDGGATWTSIAVTDRWRAVNAIRFDPHQPTRVLAAIGGGTAPGVFGSTDAGLTWTLTGPATGALGPTSIAFDPATAGVVLLGTTDGGIFRSTDGGSTWGLVHAADAKSLSFCEGSPTRVWAVGWPGEILRSDDGGATFVAGTPPPACGGDGCWSVTVAAHPSQPDGMVVGRILPYCFVGCDLKAQILHTTDAGSTWVVSHTTSGAYRDDQEWRSLEFDIDSQETVYAAIGNEASKSSRVGLFRSTDGGVVWSEWMNGLHGLAVLGAGHGPGGEQFVRGTASETCFGRSTQLDPWELLPASISSERYTPNAIEVSEAVPGIRHEVGNYSTMDSADPEFVRSTNGGVFWLPGLVPQLSLDDRPMCVASDHVTGKIVFVGIDSWDWEQRRFERYDYSSPPYPIPTDLFLDFGPLHAVVDPLDPMTLFAAGDDGLVRRSTDGALTWETRSTGLPAGSTIVGLFQDRSAPARLRVSTKASGAYATSDGGLTWTVVPILDGASSDVVAADWDPVDDRLFLATQDDGVWATGSGWLNDGLPTRDLTAVDWVPSEEMLVLGSAHSSLFGRELPAAGVAAPELAAGDSRLGLRVFPNPVGAAAATRLAFRVPGDAVAPDLAIYGVDGRLVSRLPTGPAAAGWRGAVWEGRSPSGVPVAPGVYFARLTSGDESITRRIVRLGR